MKLNNPAAGVFFTVSAVLEILQLSSGTSPGYTREMSNRETKTRSSSLLLHFKQGVKDQDANDDGYLVSN